MGLCIMNEGGASILAKFWRICAGLLVILVLCHGAESRKLRKGARDPDLIPSSCPKCDRRNCEEVHPETCMGTIQKDDCDCCPVCLADPLKPFLEGEGNETGEVKASGKSNHACKDIKCSRNKVCILNIQGIPMCRCPTAFWCKRTSAKGRPLCGDNGKTYKSRCHLKVHECNEGINIKVRTRTTCAKADRLALESATFPTVDENNKRKVKPWRLSDKKGGKRRGRKFPGGKRKKDRRDRDRRKKPQRQNKKDRADRKKRHRRRYLISDQ